MKPTRRAFGLASLALAAACSGVAQPDAGAGDGRLSARPLAPTSPGVRRGLFRLDGWPRPLAFIPPNVDEMQPAPFVLLLHGGGSNAEWTLDRMLPAAREHGVVLLAPDAEGYTWDVIRDFRDRRRKSKPPRFGPDTARVDAALKLLFETIPVNPSRCAIAGFSDGASYALSLGPRNPEVFSHIMGFSPGGVAPFDEKPHAKIFISHGRQDPMLPFANTADGVVPGFRSRRFDILFLPFDGVHSFRDQEIGRAMDWFLG